MRLLVRWLLLLGVIGIGVPTLSSRLELRESITEFLPASVDPDLDHVFQGFANSEQARRMVLTLRGADEATARQAAAALAQRLRQDPEVAWVESGPDPRWGETVYDMYFPRRLLLLSPDPKVDMAQLLSDEGLRAAALELKAGLAGPLSPLVRATAAADPLGAFPRLLERLGRLRPAGVAVVDGSFMTADRRWAIVFLGTRSSPFVAATQAPFLERLQAAFAAVDREYSGALRLERSGINRFATASAQAIRTDMVRISVFSSVAIVLVFVLLFRSLLALCAAVLPLAVGMLAALAFGYAAPNGLHVLTLAFGATLLGVCIDYPIHYLMHRTLHGDGEAQGGTRAVWSGLFLGALTTAVGFACLALSPYPGIRELAIFAATGVAAAFVCTRFLLPGLVVNQLHPRPALLRGAALAGRLMELAVRHRRIAMLGPVVALVVSLCAPFVVRWGDEVKRLNTSFPALDAEEAAVQGRVADIDSSRFVVSLGDDEEAALQVAERVDRVLDRAVREELVAGYRSITAFLWSVQTQRSNLEAVQAAPGLGSRLSESFAAEGFRRGAFAEFEQALAGDPAPLTYDELSGSRSSRAAQSHRIVVGEKVGFVTFLSGIADDAALRRLIEPVAEARYVDQAAFLRDVYAEYRGQAVALFAYGILLVTVIVALRYRRVWLVVVACGPALLGVGVSLTVLGLWVGELHLLHVLAALLVFSMGVDYGVFLLEMRQRPPELAAAALSVVLAASFTMLSFGLLAISANGALRAIGLTMAIGIPTSLAAAVLLFGILAADDPTAGENSKRRSRRGASLQRNGWILAAFMMVSLPGCGALIERFAGTWPTCELRSPTAFAGDFLWRQAARVRFGAQTMNFETAVQKQGDELRIVGLAPAAGTIFSLVLNGTDLSFDSRLWRKLPFPPCMIVEDFQRSFFPLIAGDAGPLLDGPYVGDVAGERVVEVWREGRLRQRIFFDRSMHEDRGVFIDYSGWDEISGDPRTVVIRNRRFGYELSVATTAAEELR